MTFEAWCPQHGRGRREVSRANAWRGDEFVLNQLEQEAAQHNESYHGIPVPPEIVAQAAADAAAIAEGERLIAEYWAKKEAP